MSPSTIGVPIPSVDLNQALTDVVESIALEDKALSGLLDAEGDLVQKVKNQSRSIEEYLSLNESVSLVVKAVTRLQTLIHFHFAEAHELLEKNGGLNVCDEADE